MVESQATEFDLVVNCTGKPLPKRQHTIPRGLGLSPKWQSPLLHREIVLDWPDFGLPGMPLQFWKDLLRVIKRHRRTLVFCAGGQGRTGTTLSILVMLACRMDGDQAIETVRGVYRRAAVETADQEAYINRLGEQAGYSRGRTR